MDVMTVREVAEELKVRRDTVRRMLAAGQLPGVKIGRDWRVPRDELSARLTQGLTQQADPEATPSSGDQPEVQDRPKKVRVLKS